MRDFFIRGLEALIGVILIVAAILILIVAGVTAFGTGMMPAGATIGGVPVSGLRGGPVAGIAILVGGFLYLIFLGGFLYLGLGIYHNTRRAADALDRADGRF